MDKSQMTFEQWMHRRKYVIQCYTTKIARSLSIWTPEAALRFRAFSGYRNHAANFLRKATASKILEMRRNGLINMKDIRRDHETLLQGGGTALRVSLEKMLE